MVGEAPLRPSSGMDLAYGIHRDDIALEASVVDPALNADVRFGFELEIAVPAVLASRS